jgi:hypothetical protein
MDNVLHCTLEGNTTDGSSTKQDREFDKRPPKSLNSPSASIGRMPQPVGQEALLSSNRQLAAEVGRSHNENRLLRQRQEWLEARVVELEHTITRMLAGQAEREISRK